MEPPNRRIQEMAAERAESWPDPRPDGVTELSPAQLRLERAIFAALVNYIEVQLARCKVEGDGAPSEMPVP